MIVISGPSGVGKGTLCKAMLDRYPDNYALSVSATSRLPRQGEEDGKHYIFKSREAFEAMIAHDAKEPAYKQQYLLEWAEYAGQYYGTLNNVVEQLKETGKHVLLEIDTQGACQVKARQPDTLLVFIAPPSLAMLEERLIQRNSNTPQDIRNRLQIASQELQQANQFDTTLVNNTIPQSVEALHQFIHHATSANAALPVTNILSSGNSLP
jgi:guanylate kinase